MNKSKYFIFSFVIVLTLIVSVFSISYSYIIITKDDNDINGTTNIIGYTLKVIYSDDKYVNLSNLTSEDDYVNMFKIKNESNDIIYYNINLVSIDMNITSEVSYELYEDDNLVTSGILDSDNISIYSTSIDNLSSKNYSLNIKSDGNNVYNGYILVEGVNK